MKPLVIQGMKGLGDNIYQRALVRAACRTNEVWLETCWPQLYTDLPVHPVKTGTTLRTQARNERRATTWWVPPRKVRSAKVQYCNDLRLGSSILRAMEVTSRLTAEPPLDLPAFDVPAMVCKRPYIVVRPATLRTEWANPARNPDTDQLALAVQWLRAAGYHAVSVADIAPPAEVLVGEAPADQRFESGELSVEQMLGLVRGAAAVVGGVGWIVPAVLAYQVPAFIVLGGQGAYNAPLHLVDERLDGSRIGWGMPDRFCACTDMLHRCDKKNSNLRGQFEEWHDRVLRPAQGRQPHLAA